MCSATGDRPKSGNATKRLLSTACKGFPIKVQRLIRRASPKAKERLREMANELDRRFDEELARVIGPGGRLVIDRDALGRAIVTNFPATLPGFFKTFAGLNGANEAVVAGEERLTFADLDRISDRLAHALAARGIAKGDRVAIAMR